MKKLFFILMLLSLFQISDCYSNNIIEKFLENNNENDEKNYHPGTLKISFKFTRGGIASSQYAIWVENSKGELVRTIYVTNYTAKGGYVKREDCVPNWVYKANPDRLSMKEVDAFSGATPKNGQLVYTWNGTNDKGEWLPEGEYTFYIEGTLFWENSVLFSGTVTLGGPEESSIPITSDFFDENSKNRDMIKNIKASYTP